MPPQLDHVALVVRDLDLAITSFERLGFTVTRGGRHPTGSHVAFISFHDGTCLELFSFYTPDGPRNHRYGAELERGEGLVDWCAVSDDLDRDVALHRAADLTVDDPVGKSRVRPDGVALSWRVAITAGVDRAVAPFLIQDETARADRVPPPAAHASGCDGIDTVVVSVPDLHAARRWCRSVLGVEPWATAPPGGGDTLEVRIGGVRLVWATPAGSDHPIAHHLALRGASPFELHLSAPGTGRRTLDTRHTHGARIVLVG
jgi:catechol 2,3-dioxygenase-like lactoylglutathione lyase family enzyme